MNFCPKLVAKDEYTYISGCGRESESCESRQDRRNDNEWSASGAVTAGLYNVSGPGHGHLAPVVQWLGLVGKCGRDGTRKWRQHLALPLHYVRTSAANRLIGEVVQSRRRPLLGPSPG